MDNKKQKFGQFFTKASFWLKPQIKKFIINAKCNMVYDPFAGEGDLLKTSQELLGFNKVYGLDIDNSLKWKINDSLVHIPHFENSIIITNPPYLAKQSASRQKIDLSLYWNKTHYDDLYLLALDKMIEAQKYIVAIIPESFINSSYKQKNKLSSITILEENPFKDTETPVCIVCFDNIIKEYKQINIYKNNKLVTNLEHILNIKIEPLNNVKIVFNDINGWLGLRAIDSTDDNTIINFNFKENINYDWNHKIKVSSRHFSLININIPIKQRQIFVNECNKILQKLRQESSDILLTPFKGNTKSGIRRRRLDFRLARAIMEQAYWSSKGENQHEKQSLF